MQRSALILTAVMALLLVGTIAQPVSADFWITTDAAEMPRVTDKRPTRWSAGFRGPFKYYDEAVRDMGTGTEWRQWGSEQWKPVYFSDSL